jgi:hypothetical protein
VPSPSPVNVAHPAGSRIHPSRFPLHLTLPCLGPHRYQFLNNLFFLIWSDTRHSPVSSSGFFQDLIAGYLSSIPTATTPLDSRSAPSDAIFISNVFLGNFLLSRVRRWDDVNHDWKKGRAKAILSYCFHVRWEKVRFCYNGNLSYFRNPISAFNTFWFVRCLPRVYLARIHGFPPLPIDFLASLSFCIMNVVIRTDGRFFAGWWSHLLLTFLVCGGCILGRIKRWNVTTTKTAACKV